MTSNTGFELVDHTADIVVRAWAPSREELIAPCLQGLYAVVGDLATHGALETREFEFTGDDPALLLRDFLADALFLFERDKVRLGHVRTVELSDTRLAVTAEVAAVDADSSAFEREVKAVTYHQLAVRHVDDRWEATFLVDI